MFPRADWIHALHAMPVAMLACAVAWQRLSASVPARIVVATRTAAALALLVALRRQAHPPLSDLAGGDVRWSSRPHHRGVLEPTEPRDGLDELAAALVEDARRGRSPFVLAGQAGRLWLVTGHENPLPYDYPLVSAFGRTGEEQAVGAVEDGRIRVVFVDTHMPDSLVPKRLLACVHARLVRDGTYGDRYERWRAKEDG
jgi:hypothetical protein